MQPRSIFLALLLLAGTLCRNTKMLIVFARHGARHSFGPLEDPVKAFQITPNGMRQGYLLGQFLRHSYPHFFPQRFFYRHNHISSSTPARAQVTAQAIMVGIYGPGTLNKPILVDDRLARPSLHGVPKDKIDFNTPLPQGFQPFPIHSPSQTENTMLNPFDGNTCPKIFFQEIKKNDDYTTRLVAAMNAFLPKLKTAKFDPASVLKRDYIVSFSEMDPLADWVLCQRNLGEDLGISDEVFQELMRYHTAQTYNTFFRREDLTRYTFTEWGRFAAGIVSKLLIKPEPKTYMKFALFVGHDLNLMNYLILTGNFQTKCLPDEYQKPEDCPPLPPFASSIIWEVFEEEGKLLVEARFNNEPIKICKGKVICGLQEFHQELLTLGLPDDLDHLLEQYCEDFVGTKNRWYLWMIGLNSAAIVVLAGFIWYFRRKLTRY